MTPFAGHPRPCNTLVLGGVRSGKSEFAEGLVEAWGPGLFLATAEPRDAEMKERIRRHRRRRGATWITIEEPLDIVPVLKANALPDRPVLVDCLTLWLSNLMEWKRDGDREVDALVDALADLEGSVVFVSNEVGLGIVPDNSLSRAYSDAAGRMNQRIAAAADRVVFMAAGLPLMLKDGA